MTDEIQLPEWFDKNKEDMNQVYLLCIVIIKKDYQKSSFLMGITLGNRNI